MLPFMRDQGAEKSPIEESAFAAGKTADSAPDTKGTVCKGDGHAKGSTEDTQGGQSHKAAEMAQQQKQQLQNRDKMAQGNSSKAQEYLTVAVHDKNVRKTTMLLAVLFVIGLLCLVFMIKKSTPSTAEASVNAEETQLEKAIAQLIGVKSEMFHRMDKIVKKFFEFSDVQQVKVDELAKNPFKLEAFLNDINNDGADIDMELLRQERLKGQAREMQLLSIMQSNEDRGNCCMIDDKILYKGDKIRGFEVRQISNCTVWLESEGMEIVLKLSE